jgi:phosphoglucosamine mutase
MRLVLDCANGAAYHIAPAVFGELGAAIDAIGIGPDGLNINRDCGATRPDVLAARVVDQGADLGIALDGDGDRLILVDHKGEVVDGDQALFVIARDRAATLNGAVVGTQMSNLGLEQALRGLGLDFHRASVGDRYVMEMLHDKELKLGGESSGHLINLNLSNAGDGIIAALQVLEAMIRCGKSLHELKYGMRKFPQLRVDVPLPGKWDGRKRPELDAAVRDAEARLAGRGRVLLRPSGTEPLLRVMVEGEEEALVRSLAESLAGSVRKSLERGA